MNRAPRRSGELVRGLLALVTLGLIVVGMPIALLFLGSATSTGQVLNLPSLTRTLTGPDDGTLFLTAVVAIAWAAWLALVLCLLLEVSALMRGLPTPRIPALGTAQQGVAVLVAAVTVLLSGGSVTSQLVVKPMTALSVVTPPSEPVAPALQAVTAVESGPELPWIEVQRHDTLWSLAERHLGSGERWEEIFDLNEGLRQPDGRHLTAARWVYPGWQLRLPAEAVQFGAAHSTLHVVKPGETLSAIAQEELGTADRAAALFEGNKGRPQPGGGALDDPDLIRPGWGLILPSIHRPSVPEASERHEREPEPPAEPQLQQGAVAEQLPPPPTRVGDSGDKAGQEDLVGLGLGALTASGFLLELRRRRRMQQRSRTAGSRIPMPEPAAAAVERRAAALESPQSISTTRTALRALAQSCAERGRPLPDVLLVRIGARSLRLELATDDCDPLPPFAAESDRMWTLASEPEAPETDDPYPALVALGSADGDMLLLNLEAVGALHLVDAEGDVRRALVADLAVGPFASGAPLSLVDCFEDLPVTLDPGRARVVANLEQALREAGARVRQQADQLRSLGDVRVARTAPSAGESLPPDVYVAEEAFSPPPVPWSGVCVIDQEGSDGEGWSLTVKGPGHALLEPLGLNLEPQTLGGEEFTRILDILRTGAQTTGTSAPATAVETCHAVAAALPDVPATLLDLRDEVPLPPRVLLLGRVDVENAIDEAAPHRRRRASELVAYLVLHPGASGRELDEALWPGRRVEKTTRNPFVSRARQWLGRNADGEPYLPLVADGGSYRLRPEVSCDWHDFVRFSELGLETNPPNASALSAALDLVRGRPFLGVDPTTYTWAESDTQEMISAVADVAHALAELRLEEGDLRGAREAAAKGLLAEPCSEMLFRDAIRAAIAAGDVAEVERLAARLRNEVALIDPDESLDDETLVLLGMAPRSSAPSAAPREVHVAARR